jgi:hypothetical protein
MMNCADLAMLVAEFGLFLNLPWYSNILSFTATIFNRICLNQKMNVLTMMTTYANVFLALSLLAIHFARVLLIFLKFIQKK